MAPGWPRTPPSFRPSFMAGRVLTACTVGVDSEKMLGTSGSHHHHFIVSNCTIATIIMYHRHHHYYCTTTPPPAAAAAAATATPPPPPRAVTTAPACTTSAMTTTNNNKNEPTFYQALMTENVSNKAPALTSKYEASRKEFKGFCSKMYAICGVTLRSTLSPKSSRYSCCPVSREQLPYY